ncbi:MAG: hypothetical protein KGL11_12430 [Alphaproteobacteria bacterium]|nr:hypothetical protein [Alphaproteobacteria bacterium]
MQTMKFTRLRALLLAGAVAVATAGAVATPALADEDGWRGHEWREHAWRGDDDDDWGRPAYYGYNYGYYAYPYAYAAPAPVYTAPPAVGFYFGIR